MTDALNKMDKLLQLIENQLTVNHSAKWGLMKAQDMVEHLSLVFLMSSGKFGKEFKGDIERAAKMKTNFFSVKYPFPKSVPMPGRSAEVPPLRCDIMEDSKALLKNSVKRFVEHFTDNPDEKTAHFYFGPLSFEEWIHFHTKHIEHHAMQFGLMPYPLTEGMEQSLKEIEEKLQIVYKGLMADNPAKWGKMNAHQCVEHLTLVLIYSTGKFGVPFKGDAEAVKKLWKPFVAAANPWKTVMPKTDLLGDPKPVREATIDASKKALKRAFIKYKHYCMENPDAITPHGYLGNISTAQWLQVHSKHIDHHLSQFGVIEELV